MKSILMLLGLSFILTTQNVFSSWDLDCKKEYGFVSLGLPTGIERMWEADDAFFYSKKGGVYFEERVSWSEFSFKENDEKMKWISSLKTDMSNLNEYLIITSYKRGMRFYRLDLTPQKNKLILLSENIMSLSAQNQTYYSPLHDVFVFNEKYYFLSNFSVEVYTLDAILEKKSFDSKTQITSPFGATPTRAVSWRSINGYLQAIGHENGDPKAPIFLYQERLLYSGSVDPKLINGLYYRSIANLGDNNHYYTYASITPEGPKSNLYYLHEKNSILGVPGYVTAASFLGKDLFISMGAVNIYTYGVVLIEAGKPQCRLFNSRNVTQIKLRERNKSGYLFILNNGQVLRSNIY